MLYVFCPDNFLKYLHPNWLKEFKRLGIGGGLAVRWSYQMSESLQNC